MSGDLKKLYGFFASVHRHPDFAGFDEIVDSLDLTDALLQTLQPPKGQRSYEASFRGLTARHSSLVWCLAYRLLGSPVGDQARLSIDTETLKGLASDPHLEALVAPWVAETETFGRSLVNAFESMDRWARTSKGEDPNNKNVDGERREAVQHLCLAISGLLQAHEERTATDTERVEQALQAKADLYAQQIHHDQQKEAAEELDAVRSCGSTTVPNLCVLGRTKIFSQEDLVSMAQGRNLSTEGETLRRRLDAQRMEDDKHAGAASMSYGCSWQGTKCLIDPVFFERVLGELSSLGLPTHLIYKPSIEERAPATVGFRSLLYPEVVMTRRPVESKYPEDVTVAKSSFQLELEKTRAPTWSSRSADAFLTDAIERIQVDSNIQTQSGLFAWSFFRDRKTQQLRWIDEPFFKDLPRSVKLAFVYTLYRMPLGNLADEKHFDELMDQIKIVLLQPFPFADKIAAVRAMCDRSYRLVRKYEKKNLNMTNDSALAADAAAPKQHRPRPGGRMMGVNILRTLGTVMIGALMVSSMPMVAAASLQSVNPTLTNLSIRDYKNILASSAGLVVSNKFSSLGTNLSTFGPHAKEKSAWPLLYGTSGHKKSSMHTINLALNPAGQNGTRKVSPNPSYEINILRKSVLTAAAVERLIAKPDISLARSANPFNRHVDDEPDAAIQRRINELVNESRINLEQMIEEGDAINNEMTLNLLSIVDRNDSEIDTEVLAHAAGMAVLLHDPVLPLLQLNHDRLESTIGVRPEVVAASNKLIEIRMTKVYDKAVELVLGDQGVDLKRPPPPDSKVLKAAWEKHMSTRPDSPKEVEAVYVDTVVDLMKLNSDSEVQHSKASIVKLIQDLADVASLELSSPAKIGEAVAKLVDESIARSDNKNRWALLQPNLPKPEVFDLAPLPEVKRPGFLYEAAQLAATHAEKRQKVEDAKKQQVLNAQKEKNALKIAGQNTTIDKLNKKVEDLGLKTLVLYFGITAIAIALTRVAWWGWNRIDNIRAQQKVSLSKATAESATSGRTARAPTSDKQKLDDELAMLQAKIDANDDD